MNIPGFIKDIKAKLNSGEILSNATIKFDYSGMKTGVYVNHVTTTYQDKTEYLIVVRDNWRKSYNGIYTISDLIKDIEKEYKVCCIYNDDNSENIFLSFEAFGYRGCPYKVKSWKYDKDINIIILSDKESIGYKVQRYIQQWKKEQKKNFIQKLYKDGHNKVFVKNETIEEINKLLNGIAQVTIDKNSVVVLGYKE